MEMSANSRCSSPCSSIHGKIEASEQRKCNHYNKVSRREGI